MVISELLEALYFRNIQAFINKVKEVDSLYYPHNPKKHQQAINAYLLETIPSKENLLNRMDDYAQNGKPIWQSQDAQYCDQMTYENLQATFRNNSLQKGEKIAAR